jgi:hypothetical protein
MIHATMIRALTKVTTWERMSLSKRLLAAFGRVLMVFVLLAAIGYGFLRNKYSIEAKVWHWRHGYWTTIGSYQIPVPDRWLIMNSDSSGFTLVNTSTPPRPRDGKIHTTAVINVLGFRDRSTQTGWKDFWLSREHERLVRDQVEVVEERTLTFADESINCIGGKELSTMLRDEPHLAQMDTISLNCMSERGLNVMFVGESSDVQAFYTFISQIQRQN